MTHELRQKLFLPNDQMAMGHSVSQFTGLLFLIFFVIIFIFLACLIGWIATLASASKY